MAKSQWVQAIVFSITANTDRYKVLSSSIAVATFSTTEASANISCERQLTFSKLCVVITTNSKTLSNPTIKFRNNGADGNMSISIPFGVTGTYSDMVNTDTVTAGNNFCLVYRYGASGTGTLTTSAISIVADYTGSETITVFGNHTLTTVTAGVRYASSTSRKIYYNNATPNTNTNSVSFPAGIDRFCIGKMDKATDSIITTTVNYQDAFIMDTTMSDDRYTTLYNNYFQASFFTVS